MKYIKYFFHLVKKIFYLCVLFFLKQKEFKPGVFLLGQKTFSKGKRFVFYFDNPDYMHPGDHLFFEPLMRWLKQMQFNVCVLPTASMRSYFDQNGYMTDVHLQKSDVIITRPEMLFEVQKFSKAIILIHTACSSINQPLINYLVDVFAVLFQIESKKIPVDCRPSKQCRHKDQNAKLHLLQDEKYVLFSNYIASGKFRIGKKKKFMLIEFAKKFKTLHNCKFIHVGSNSDRLNDQTIYDFIDLDLRGETSIDDLFYLASLPHVLSAVTFDNFIMHLMAINEKKSFVLFRGRWTRQAHNYHINYINPPFKTDKKLIEYI